MRGIIIHVVLEIVAFSLQTAISDKRKAPLEYNINDMEPETEQDDEFHGSSQYYFTYSCNDPTDFNWSFYSFIYLFIYL